jgi:hypothetical protein
MLDNDLSKEGLPPRDRNADVPEHADHGNRGAVWMGGIIAVCVVIALIIFGGSGTNNTASNSLNTEPGTTTGAAPTTPPQKAR